MISSRTPEGWFGRCKVCGYEGRVEPSHPTDDAPCPDCGTLNWFDPPDEFVQSGDDLRALLSVYDVGNEFAMPVGDVDGLMDQWDEAGRPRRVVLDFTGIRFIDSAALGRLIRLHQRVALLGGRLRIRGLSDDIRKLFNLTRLDDMLGMDEE